MYIPFAYVSVLITHYMHSYLFVAKDEHLRHERSTHFENGLKLTNFSYVFSDSTYRVQRFWRIQYVFSLKIYEKRCYSVVIGNGYNAWRSFSFLSSKNAFTGTCITPVSISERNTLHKGTISSTDHVRHFHSSWQKGYSRVGREVELLFEITLTETPRH